MQEVTFRVDYAVPNIGREFGTVILGDKNVAMLVVSEGWAKVCPSIPRFESLDLCFGPQYLLAERDICRLRSRVPRRGKQVLSLQNCYVSKSKQSNKVLAAGARFFLTLPAMHSIVKSNFFLMFLGYKKLRSSGN